MTPQTEPKQAVGVYARWRPLVESETEGGEILRQTTRETDGFHSLTISRTSSPADRPWKSAAAFTTVFEPTDNNDAVFNAAVAPAIPRVLDGASCNFFAYGSTGSGKTHTIFGYHHEVQGQLGVCLAAAQQLFTSLQTVHADNKQLGVGLRVFELRKNNAFDLLNGRTVCHIREGPDGKTHVRGPTELLDDGKVRVCPIVQFPCWNFDDLRQKLLETLQLRAVGTSTTHDQSSRTHAVIEFEVVIPTLLEARQRLLDRQSELVPVGKRTTDIYLEETMKSLMKGPDGKWVKDPDKSVNQSVIDAAEAKKAEYESRVLAAEQEVQAIMTSDDALDCVGGKLVFVDLAGSEYQQDGKGSIQSFRTRQTPQERQEGRQINTDLLALKEVIRALATNQTRIPFRSSPLTMVLREHFLGEKDGSSSMIVTASPAKTQYPATLNSLKYAGMLGVVKA